MYLQQYIYTIFTPPKVHIQNFEQINLAKCPKISNTLFLPFLAYFFFFLFLHLFLLIHSGKASIVDPDQTAPSGAVWSRSALFAHAILLGTVVY